MTEIPILSSVSFTSSVETEPPSSMEYYRYRLVTLAERELQGQSMILLVTRRRLNLQRTYSTPVTSMPPQASDVALEYPPQASDEALEHSTQALDEEFEHEWRSPSYVISSYSSLHGALGNNEDIIRMNPVLLGMARGDMDQSQPELVGSASIFPASILNSCSYNTEHHNDTSQSGSDLNDDREMCSTPPTQMVSVANSEFSVVSDAPLSGDESAMMDSDEPDLETQSQHQYDGLYQYTLEVPRFDTSGTYHESSEVAQADVGSSDNYRSCIPSQGLALSTNTAPVSSIPGSGAGGVTVKSFHSEGSLPTHPDGDHITSREDMTGNTSCDDGSSDSEAEEQLFARFLESLSTFVQKKRKRRMGRQLGNRSRPGSSLVGM